jgi:DNA modification methylase
MTTAPEYLLTRGDAVDWLRQLPDASVDLLITDPPYESLEKHRAIGTTTRLKQLVLRCGYHVRSKAHRRASWF